MMPQHAPKEPVAEGRSAMSAKIKVNAGPPPALGRILLEREIPSDPALVMPLVVRTVEFLKSEKLIAPEAESKIALCLEEALQNAVTHGNKRDFKRKVLFQIFRGKNEWGVRVSDEGPGFDMKDVPDPLGSEGVWGESGRGIYLMAHYMDWAEYFNGGNTVVMSNKF
ncbi:MAG TPA: ATP-binding protein [Planctomycetota bacterium]|nr:ATP-binding protein [Planctomycetota bacterium]